MINHTQQHRVLITSKHNNMHSDVSFPNISSTFFQSDTIHKHLYFNENFSATYYFPIQ